MESEIQTTGIEDRAGGESVGALPFGISVIVPVYNGQDTLVELIGRLESTLRGRTRKFEAILINDGSQDESWKVIIELTAQHSWIRGIDLMQNYGQHSALLAGIREAQHEVIVTMDDDLQNPPEEITNLVQKLQEGFDVVYGTPKTGQHGLWRNVASHVTKFALQSTMGADTARYVSAFRAFRTEVRDAFATYQGPFVSIDVLLTWGTSRFGMIRVRHDARQTGVSNYTLLMLATHALNMVTGFTTWPLRVASLIGFGFTLLGIALFLYVIGRYFALGGSVPGFPFLASIIAIFSGAQLFALGIMGEYLARMHYRMMERPSYVIRRSIPRRKA